MERRHGMRPQQVLVVDDSSDIREVWRVWLNCWGFAVGLIRFRGHLPKGGYDVPHAP